MSIELKEVNLKGDEDITTTTKIFSELMSEIAMFLSQYKYIQIISLLIMLILCQKFVEMQLDCRSLKWKENEDKVGTLVYSRNLF